MTIVINFVTLLGFSAPFQHVVSGCVLILALFIGVVTTKR
jgi:ABC-type xylose transport system permease subunit